MSHIESKNNSDNNDIQRLNCDNSGFRYSLNKKENEIYIEVLDLKEKFIYYSNIKKNDLENSNIKKSLTVILKLLFNCLSKKDKKLSHKVYFVSNNTTRTFSPISLESYKPENQSKSGNDSFFLLNLTYDNKYDEIVDYLFHFNPKPQSKESRQKLIESEKKEKSKKYIKKINQLTELIRLRTSFSSYVHDKIKLCVDQSSIQPDIANQLKSDFELCLHDPELDQKQKEEITNDFTKIEEKIVPEFICPYIKYTLTISGNVQGNFNTLNDDKFHTGQKAIKFYNTHFFQANFNQMRYIKSLEIAPLNGFTVTKARLTYCTNGSNWATFMNNVYVSQYNKKKITINRNIVGFKITSNKPLALSIFQFQ